jgi:protease-4
MRRGLVGLLTLAAAGCFNGLLIKPVFVDGPVHEVVVTKPEHWCCRDKVALIDVEGMIVNARVGGMLSPGENPVTLFHERLQAAAEDKHVKAVVLRINSPGGGVTASDIMYRDLCTFRAKTGKPVVACMMDVAASGGYYLAMGADHVVAHPTTVTGSIGVIMSLYNVSGLFKWAGIESDPIKSGPNKDLGNPARPMTDAERAILQSVVDGFYARFVEVVAAGRQMSAEQVQPLADGRVYSGAEAHRLGLVDQVGYLDDAVCAARELACLSDTAVVAYDRCNGYRGSIYAAAPTIPGQVNVHLDVPGLTPSQHGPAFLYLWRPGVP